MLMILKEFVVIFGQAGKFGTRWKAHKKMQGGIEIWPNIWVLLKELAHNNMMIVVNFVHTITYRWNNSILVMLVILKKSIAIF